MSQIRLFFLAYFVSSKYVCRAVLSKCTVIQNVDTGRFATIVVQVQKQNLEKYNTKNALLSKVLLCNTRMSKSSFCSLGGKFYQ